MSLTQAVMMSEKYQAPIPPKFWELAISGSSPSLTCTLSDTTIWPGTSDFCWEAWLWIDTWWNSPALICGWGSGGNQGNPSLSALGLTINGDNVGTAATFKVYSNGVEITSTDTPLGNASDVQGKWGHVAMCRNGADINVYWNGTLVSSGTGLTQDWTQANFGGADAFFLTGGPVGDRDQTYDWGVSGNLRNIRFTVGSPVYTTSFTPPPITTNIAPITGTRYIFWPASNSTGSPTYGYGPSAWLPDYNPNNMSWYGSSGSSSSYYPDIVAAYSNASLTSLAVMTPVYTTSAFNTPVQGTWTNQGTNPNQPKIATGGPSPIIGTSCADFTASGTSVNIISSDTNVMAGINNSVLIYLWFYVPDFITNEAKNIINYETTNGFVLNIGRPGYGLDWMSIYNYQGTELAYAPHIWARNQWNYLALNRYYNGNPPSSGGDGTFVGFAGAATQSYAQNLNITSTGVEHYDFASSGGALTIGSKTGSSVSCQMYLNLVQMWTPTNNEASGYLYDISLAGAPVQTTTTRSDQVNLNFTFQGTAGDTNLQPGGF